MRLMQKLLDTGLPLAPFLSAIKTGLNEKGAAVVRADTGSGKSTLLPLSLLEEAERGGENPDKAVTRNEGKIVLLEPRRAAAMGVAARMADMLGEKIGERVGYAVRLERKVSSRTRIEVLTEGLFIRRIQSDPALAGISTLIFDEFHERSAMTDLALAFLLDLRRMGSPVRILIMSATVEAGEIGAFIDRIENRASGAKVPVFDVPGRAFPVEIEYRPLPGKGPLGLETGTALPKLLEAGKGDTLVFLPGRREIADAERAFRSWEGAGSFETLPLHGGLPLARQREITGHRDADDKKRRVILSTNIAESALTIPGISLVVDSGYVRLERFHVPTALNRLSREEASWMSAFQRTGRAGRLGPGRCVRLWDPSSGRPEATAPEIRRIDLSGLALECLLWGIRSRTGLPWLEEPPAAAWERAIGLLFELGAIDEKRNPTSLGIESVKLGLDPRLGILCLAGKKAGRPGLACAAASALSDRDGSMIDGDGDFRSRLSLLRHFAGRRDNPGDLKKSAVSWAKSVMETRDDLLRRLSLPANEDCRWSMEAEADSGELLSAAFPDRIAAKQDKGRFRFCSGREARIEGPLENSGWLIAVEVDAGERSAFIRLAVPVSEETALRILEKRASSEISVEWKGLVPQTVIRRGAGRLPLGEERRLSSKEEAAAGLPRLLAEKGLGILPWEEGKAAARILLERMRFFVKNAGGRDSWTDETLVREAHEWLVPFIDEPKNRIDSRILTFSSLKNALENRFGWDLIPILDKEAPESFAFPSGRLKTIEYASMEPILSVRLQDCFGISIHPRIMGTPVIFHLLSPADRPVQITSDIAGFWSGSYAEVRKEMKGRYPKHFWPENPRAIG